MNTMWIRFTAFLFLWTVGCAPSHSRTSSEQDLPKSDASSAQAFLIPDPYQIVITGNQFRWQMRYPGADGLLDTYDDVLTDDDLHVPAGVTIDLELKSLDFVYLVSLPEFGVKEVAVPSLIFHLIFHPAEIGEFAFNGDEICGDPHPQLKCRLIVESVSQFEDWLWEKAKKPESRISVK